MNKKGIQTLQTISASKLKTYKTCARQYYYKYMLPYHERPADDKNVAALLGTALHRAIELKYRNGDSPTAVFQNVMSETLDEWERKNLKINAASYFTQAQKVGKDILKSFDWDKFNPIELEYAFTLPFPDNRNPLVNITGYIDLIDTSGIVVDHKSASQAPIQDELDNDVQFLIYAWAYQQLYHTQPKKVIWNHLRTAKLYEAHVMDNYDDKIEQLTQDIKGMLAATHFVRRQIDETCRKRCSFFENCYGVRSTIEDGV